MNYTFQEMTETKLKILVKVNTALAHHGQFTASSNQECVWLRRCKLHWDPFLSSCSDSLSWSANQIGVSGRHGLLLIQHTKSTENPLTNATDVGHTAKTRSTDSRQTTALWDEGQMHSPCFVQKMLKAQLSSEFNSPTKLKLWQMCLYVSLDSSKNGVLYSFIEQANSSEMQFKYVISDLNLRRIHILVTFIIFIFLLPFSES